MSWTTHGDFSKVSVMLLSLVFILLNAPSAWSVAPDSTEIPVSLLGQPCLLKGPLEGEVLKKIHSIGPAQIYPNLSPPDQPGADEQVSKALNKLRSVTDLPSQFDRYRENLTTRLKELKSFLAALNESSISQALEKLKKPAKESEMKKYDGLLQRLKASKKDSSAYHELIEQVFEIYSDLIEPDPESLFHTALKKLGIQYNCTFDENEGPSTKESKPNSKQPVSPPPTAAGG